MDAQAAKVRVQIWIQEKYRWASSVPQILDARTVERDFGWIFSFRLPDRPTPKTFEDITGLEHAPVAIDRTDGSITVCRDSL